MTSISSPSRQKDQLIRIIRERSFKSGVDIKLASGRSSSFYFNMKPTMMHPEGARLIAELTLDAIKDDRPDLAGGLEMGAVPLAAALAAVSHVRGVPLQTFFVRKQAKEHGTQSLVEGLAPGETFAGKRVIVLEDVTTTGGSALKAVQMVGEAGGEVVRVVTVVDRREGAMETFSEARIAFSALIGAEEFAD